ncbi:hypothetical protein LTS01_026117, partial [Friedmanniomyces endolithicus]
RHLPHPGLVRRLRHLPAQHPHRPVHRRLGHRLRLAGRAPRGAVADRAGPVHRGPDRVPARAHVLDRRLPGPGAQYAGDARQGAA